MDIHLLPTGTFTVFQQRSPGSQSRKHLLSDVLQEVCAEPHTTAMRKWTKWSLNAFIFWWEAINNKKSFLISSKIDHLRKTTEQVGFCLENTRQKKKKPNQTNTHKALC